MAELLTLCEYKQRVVRTTGQPKQRYEWRAVGRAHTPAARHVTDVQQVR